jgi:hypothetical protein
VASRARTSFALFAFFAPFARFARKCPLCEGSEDGMGVYARAGARAGRCDAARPARRAAGAGDGWRMTRTRLGAARGRQVSPEAFLYVTYPSPGCASSQAASASA